MKKLLQNKEMLVGIIFLIIGVVYFALAFTIPIYDAYGGSSVVDSSFVPKVVGILLIVLSILQLIFSSKAAKNAPAAQTTQASEEDEEFKVEDWDDEEVLSNLYALSDSTVLLGELLELLRYRFEQIDFIDEPVDLGFDCPLDLHCTYTRDQLLVALDFMKPSTVREGVKWLPEKSIDVFFVTLNKADKDYSPTTMYNDYSINESLFHWQSQSTTAENSPTGQRYIHHKERGSKVLLFVREFKADRMTGGAEAYTYLGTANYVKHTGSRPMNITWQLDRPIPAKFLKKTNKLVVG